MENANSLKNVLEAVQQFQVVKCNMHHERVAVDTQNNPIHKLNGDAIIFDRVDLCDLKLRNVRLGCAHSGVNMKFENLVALIILELPECSTTICKLHKTFNKVVTKIYTLDHKKGQLEHDLALSDLNSDAQKKEELLMRFKVFKAQHETYMVRLYEVKTALENLLKDKLNITD